MLRSSNWIEYAKVDENACPVYKKSLSITKKVKNAKLFVTARGVYSAYINGQRISDYVLAPGWTVYEKRHQYQEYDITCMLKAENELEVIVANGWYQFEKNNWINELYTNRKAGAIIARLELMYDDGETDTVVTDESWLGGLSKVIYSDIYNGEIYDATKTVEYGAVAVMDYPKDALIPQEGEIICEHERLKPIRYIVTPKGERVIDFGQNLTGYVEFSVDAKCGDRVKLSHCEVLDKDGNFYTENYREAKANVEYICRDGVQTYKPELNFYGFRYIRLDEFPGEVNPDDFTAIAVHSDIKRTGFLSSGNELLNKLFSNIIWGQKSNYLDIPTDCPQRDERIGWTGDAQVFMKAGCYNYDVNRFFEKWLSDLSCEQFGDGMVPQTVPDVLKIDFTSSGWGDAAVVCPWQMYLMYGNKEILRRQFSSMKKWVDYIGNVTEEPYLWIGGAHHGDHLSIDGEDGTWDSNVMGKSDHGLISSAYYAYSTELFIKAGKALGEDMQEYEELYKKIVEAFRKRFPVYKTQTENILALVFGLAENPKKAAKDLADLIHSRGDSLTTGFLGTPYILYALSKAGYIDLAYTLLLREEYPSWLFSVRMGATTVWEHWDGVREDGSFWDSAMNSFNHYSYGAVINWVYEVAAGISPIESTPGFEKVHIAPNPDLRLGHLEATLDTKYGRIKSRWAYQTDGSVRYEITTPVEAEIVIDGKKMNCQKGEYVFYSC